MPGDDVSSEARRDKWAQVVSDVAGPVQAPVQINQDCNMFVTELSPNTAAPPFELREGRQAYMLCLEGTVAMNGSGQEPSLRRHDAAQLKGPIALELNAGTEGAYALIVEMAKG